MAKNHGRPRGRRTRPPRSVPPHIARESAQRHARRRDEKRKEIARYNAGMSDRARRIMAGAEDPDAPPDFLTKQLELAKN